MEAVIPELGECPAWFLCLLPTQSALGMCKDPGERPMDQHQEQRYIRYPGDPPDFQGLNYFSCPAMG